MYICRSSFDSWRYTTPIYYLMILTAIIELINSDLVLVGVSCIKMRIFFYHSDYSYFRNQTTLFVRYLNF